MIPIPISQERYPSNPLKCTPNVMKLAIVVAVADQGAIGQGNDLLWHLPADLKRFKALTSGHTILMGRKTFDSLPKGALPNRRNIVISRRVKELPGAEVYASVEEALQVLHTLNEEVYVIGGGEIYRQLLPQVQRIYLTQVAASFPDADVFFPQLNWSEWQLVSKTAYPADEHNAYAFELLILDRLTTSIQNEQNR